MIQTVVKQQLPNLQIFKVTDVPYKTSGKITQAKLNIKHPNSGLQYDDVPMMGTGLGHLKGVYMYPSVDDFVIVGFLGDQPIVLGSVNDFFTQTPDSVPQIEENEVIVVGKEKGQYIYLNNSGDILIKTVNGAKIKITEDNTFKIFNADDYGIECDASGDVTVYSNTVVKADQGGVPNAIDVPTTVNGAGTW